MRLDPKPFASAAAAVTAFLWLVCSAAVSVAPGAAGALAERMMHARASQLSLQLSWGGVLIGLVAWTVSAAIAAGLFAWTYNRLTPRASS